MALGRPLVFIALLLPLTLSTHACTSSPVVPPSLEPQVDPELTFAALKREPNAHLGRLALLGGEVLDATLLKDGTRIEILHLPLQANQEPGTDRLASEGRFLAMQRDFLDPATLPPGTRVTIVGEVSGTKTLPLDETEYTYPLLTIRSLRAWPPLDSSPYRFGVAPYMGPSYWSPYWGPYWRPVGPRSPYWW